MIASFDSNQKQVAQSLEPIGAHDYACIEIAVDCRWFMMYDAFPAERFGSFRGTIVRISRTILAPKEVDAAVEIGEPVYAMRVALAQQSVTAFGESVPLQPGMTLRANIVLDRRTFFDWLMEPINAVRERE